MGFPSKEIRITWVSRRMLWNTGENTFLKNALFRWGSLLGPTRAKATWSITPNHGGSPCVSKFIVIEGIDGAGKGTHTRRLAQVLQEKSFDVSSPKNSLYSFFTVALMVFTFPTALNVKYLLKFLFLLNIT